MNTYMARPMSPEGIEAIEHKAKELGLSVTFNKVKSACEIHQGKRKLGSYRHEKAVMTFFDGIDTGKELTLPDEIHIRQTGSTFHAFYRFGKQYVRIERPELPAFSIEAAIRIAKEAMGWDRFLFTFSVADLS